jgi:nitroimidazol reductase NimA-like FMN-containing flavoprotein (pyridoxamine 5'-phosphate oxidase superfamily)
MAELEPTPEQLSSPRGTPLTALSWADVRTRVAEAEDFLLATTDPDGRPHVVPVLGVWLEGTVCFVTFRQSRKARNLVQNNGCAVTVPGHDVDLVLEGTALNDPRHVYAVEPAQVFAFGKEQGFSATRWRF